MGSSCLISPVLGLALLLLPCISWTWSLCFRVEYKRLFWAGHLLLPNIKLPRQTLFISPSLR